LAAQGLAGNTVKCTVHLVYFLYFLKEISWESVPKKVLNNFKRLMA